MATGFVYFLIFLVPLWISYLGRARSIRFGLAYAATLLVLGASVVLTSADLATAGRQTLALLSWDHWQLNDPEADNGIWSADVAYHRIPVFVGFLTLTTALVLRRSRGRFIMLLSGTAAIILTAQFWYAQASGLYISWYLPLLLLTVFRPSRSEWLAAEDRAPGGYREVRASVPTTV
jgi:hypothetical protein